MLSKESPQKNCGIRNRNERIQAIEFLNQGRAFDLEAMLLGDPIRVIRAASDAHISLIASRGDAVQELGLSWITRTLAVGLRLRFAPAQLSTAYAIDAQDRR
jgi:hypothetical protein